jgi:hypothetical protein
MYNVEKISNWDLRVNIETSKPCELYVDNFPTSPKTSLRVLWVVEPDEVSTIKNIVIGRQEEFDLILAYDEDILKNCSNAKLYPHGMSWILDFDFAQEKQFAVTSLVGGKKLSPNHFLRQELPKVQNDIKSVEFHLFNSVNNPYQGDDISRTMKDGDRKNELFYSQYHIAIENFSKKNYFSEKLIDCFQTKTIPIYVGCPNIGDFYDTRGMFIVNSLEEIVEVCNSLTPETYQSMLEYVEKNFELSIPHAKFRETLRDEIIKFVDNN